ncbi:MAG: hypothetical protein AAF870_05115, partial [Pseudomonadota bacterium]
MAPLFFLPGMGPMTSAMLDPEERAGNVILLVQMNRELLPASPFRQFLLKSPEGDRSWKLPVFFWIKSSA